MRYSSYSHQLRLLSELSSVRSMQGVALRREQIVVACGRQEADRLMVDVSSMQAVFDRRKGIYSRLLAMQGGRCILRVREKLRYRHSAR